MKKRTPFFVILLLMLAFFFQEKLYKTCNGSIYETVTTSFVNSTKSFSRNIHSTLKQLDSNLHSSHFPTYRAGPNHQSSIVNNQPPFDLALGTGLKLGKELPYESALSISGRQLIGSKFSTKRRYDRDKNQWVWETSYEPKQELQVKIGGQIGDERVKVNVDYDSTKTDKRDISVVYKGEPGEAVQEIAFGDLDLLLPQTEFVGYRKQVFGLRAQAQHKNLRFMALASQTKGTSESKIFYGDTPPAKREIADRDYIRRKYYKIYFDETHLPIPAGREKIYLDDRNSANNTLTTKTLLVESYTVPKSTYVGDFDELSAGVDYILDYSKGIIIFRKTIAANYVLAVDYPGLTKAEGTAAILIKNENETINQELKNFYSLGATKIVRDDGKGNFIFKVYNVNDVFRSTITIIPGTERMVSYPDYVEVDFENGIFHFKEEPFPADTYNPSPPAPRYMISVEFRYRVKQYTLRPNIIIGSERIVLDGKVLQRDKDYFLDYESGLLTFYLEEEIKKDSKIEATYEYAPFAGFATGETLVGARTEFSPLKNFFLGSTIISNFTLKPERIPDIRSAPTRTLLWEIDACYTNLKFPLIPLRMTNLSFEYAQSVRNPNTFGKALIDSMEGVKTIDSASLDKDYWYPASPSGYKIPLAFALSKEEITLGEINPSLAADKKSEKQQLLVIDYNLTSSSLTSIIQPISKIGLDYTKKLFLETQILGDGKEIEMDIEYGTFNEDADNDNLLETEDLNSDGVLNSEEDKGWFYHYDSSITPVGANNGRLDTEDLDGDGKMNPADNWALKESFRVNWNTWTFIAKQLSVIDSAQLSMVKQVRITLKGSGKGKLKIASLSLTGNKWEKYTTAGATVTVNGINNEDNPEYIALYDETKGHKNIYQDLYPDWDSRRWRREQALSVNYILGPGATATVYSSFAKAQDFSKYRQVKFFLYPKTVPQGEIFFFRFGTETDYYEYCQELKSTGKWSAETIDFGEFEKMLRANQSTATVNSATYRLNGSPKRTNIMQIKIGIYNSSTDTIKSELWVNEIFLDKVEKVVGEAKKIESNFEIPNWLSFGGKYKEINDKFQPLTPVIFGQKMVEQNAYLNFVRIRFLPLNFTFSRKDTETPIQSILENPWLTSLEEDKVTSLSASGGLTFTYGRLPRIGFSYTENLTDYLRKQNRLDLKDSYNANLDYTIPINFLLFPRTINLTYRRDEFSLWRSTWPFVPLTAGKEKFFFNQYKTKIAYQDTEEITDEWGTRTNFNFWSKIILNPNYSLRTVTEEKIQERVKYDKSLSQVVGVTSNLSFFSWFNPALSYNITSKEDTNLATVTSTAPVKRVDRTANGEMNWNFTFRQVFPQVRLLRSLTLSTNYRLEYGDSYENIPTKVKIQKQLWIPNPLKLDGKSLLDQRKSLTERNTSRLSSRWVPLETVLLPYRFTPFNTLGITANYLQSKEYNETTGTKRTVYTVQWPDLIFSLLKGEKLFYLEKVIADSQINLKILNKVVRTVDLSKVTTLTDSADCRFLLLKKYSLYFDYSFTKNDDFNEKTNTGNKLTKNESFTSQVNFNLKIWRFTFRNEYKINREWDSKVYSEYPKNPMREDTTYSPSLQVYANFTLPAELQIPLLKRTISLANQLVFNSTLRLDQKRVKSLGQPVFGANTDTYTLSTSADYTVSPNARMTLGIGATSFNNRDNWKANYYSFEGSLQIIIQF